MFFHLFRLLCHSSCYSLYGHGISIGVVCRLRASLRILVLQRCPLPSNCWLLQKSESNDRLWHELPTTKHCGLCKGTNKGTLCTWKFASDASIRGCCDGIVPIVLGVSRWAEDSSATTWGRQILETDVPVHTDFCGWGTELWSILELFCTGEVSFSF